MVTVYTTCNKKLSVFSGFRRDVYKIYALLGCYTALGGSSVPTVRNNILTLEDGTDRFSRNVGTELPFNAA
jgi:hypothetical protein